MTKKKKSVILLGESKINEKLKMTPQEQKQLQEHLNQIAQILYCNTPSEKLQDFESIEYTVREQILSQVSPIIGEFFFTQDNLVVQAEPEKSKPLWE